MTNVVQDRIDEFRHRRVEDPVLGSLVQPADLQEYLQAGFSALLNATLLKERFLFLKPHPEDRAKGYAPTRQIQVRTTPVPVERPRTREGFYPAFLPKHQRHIPESYQELLEQILLESKSFDSALRTLQAMGLSYSRKEFEALLAELDEEAQVFHQRSVAPDGLILYIEAKELDLKDEHDQVKKAVHCLVIGVNFEARKEVLAPITMYGS